MSTLKQLSGQDATFLYLDTDRASTGGTMMYIYDQSNLSDGKLRFKQILKHIESRIDTSPIFRRKIKQLPFAVDYPYWVTDKKFKIENHVSHIALPKPGDWRQFCILASRLTRPHFDMSRPLWEMYVVEGLDNIDWLPKGCFAILTRMHHAAVDGTAAAELTWALHDTAINAVPNEQVAKKPECETIDDPSFTEMIARACWNNTTSPMRLAKPLSNILPALVGKKIMEMATKKLAPQIDNTSSPIKIPKTRFNKRVSPNRVFTSTRFPLTELKTIKKVVDGCTINDIVVTIISGALRQYLNHHGELPEESLVAAMPVNTRSGADTVKGSENQITFMAAAMGSNIEDPIERLKNVYSHTSNSKTILDGIGAKDLTDINRHVPSALLAAAGKMISHVGFDSAGTGKRLFNVGISNVPGPSVPLYLQGAKLRFWSIVGPLVDGMGAMFAVTSYNDELFICPTACRDIVDDPEFLGQCIEQSYHELLQATEAAPKQNDTQANRGQK